MVNRIEHSIGAEKFLQKTDPEPAELVNEQSSCPVLLVCEHAGQEIPQSLANLGLSIQQRGLHIAYDIGAEGVARRLSGHLGCTLILQRYSRLVIDCNRPVRTPESIPEVSDAITIPGNTGMSDDQRLQREQSIFTPFTALCKAQIARSDIGFTFSIHSFTPQMDGQSRPWDIGFLYRDNHSQGEHLVALGQQLWPELTIGQNEPYGVDDTGDWFIPVCAEPSNIPHCLIEIRNDHISTEHGCEIWARRLHHLISTFIERSHETHT